MYEDNKYQIKINWKNILFVVGIIALTVIVMMLVMPKLIKMLILNKHLQQI